MSNVKISQLPEYTGNTSGSWLIMNNSGETTTYKVKKENWVFPYNGNATITGSLDVSGSASFGINWLRSNLSNGQNVIVSSNNLMEAHSANNALSAFNNANNVLQINGTGKNRFIGPTEVTGSLNVSGSVQRPFNVQSSFSGTTTYSFGTGSLAANFVQSKSQGFSLLTLIGSGSNDQATLGLQNSKGYTDLARIDNDTSILNSTTDTGSFTVDGFSKVIVKDPVEVTGSLNVTSSFIRPIDVRGAGGSRVWATMSTGSTIFSLYNTGSRPIFYTMENDSGSFQMALSTTVSEKKVSIGSGTLDKLTFGNNIEVTGSLNLTNKLNLKAQNPLPAGVLGDLAVSSSNALYFHNGTSWTLIS